RDFHVTGVQTCALRICRGERTTVSVTSSYEVAAQVEAEARRRGFIVGGAEYSDRVVQRFAVAENELATLEALTAEISAGTAQLTDRKSVVKGTGRSVGR